MVETFELAEAYLTSRDESFWEWVDHGEAVRWKDGPTIAVRLELPHVLQPLVEKGLPPLEIVLLLLSACRHRWNDASEEVLARLTRSHRQFVKRGGGRMWLEATVRCLQQVNSLPPELRTPTEAKVVLCEAVFERYPDRVGPDVSRAVVELLRGKRLPETVIAHVIDVPSISMRTQNLMALCHGIQRIDADSLAIRTKTSLDRLPAPLDADDALREEEPERLTIRQLLKVMDVDDELAGLAKLTRNLQAVVHLPRLVDEPEELPLGGVSDITNRGPFDRLLLSELANDSETLMTRVALGEALYLRREKPPSHPPRRRVLLLDSGIRMWGVPRVFACAVALSLAAEADEQDDTHVFRADGDRVQPVDFATKDGLIEHLAALDPHAHPGESLPAVLDVLGEEACDLVIVSCPEALGDRTFRRQLQESDIERCYLASVTREGRFQLTARSARGEKLLKEATFDLGALLSPPDKRPPIRDDARRTHPLPAIFRAEPFPLRLSHRLDASTIWSPDGETALAITADRRWMCWDEAQLGGRQLTDRLPGTNVRWRGRVGAYNDELFAAVIEHAQYADLWLVTAIPGSSDSTIVPMNLRTRGLLSLTQESGMLLAIYKDRAVAVDPIGNRIVSEARLHRQLLWRHGRYFRGDGGWFCLSLQGSQLVTEPVLTAKQPDEYDIVFYCESAREHVAVTREGSVVFLDQEQRRDLPSSVQASQIGRFHVADVSDDGNWMEVEFQRTISDQYQYSMKMEYSLPSLEYVAPGVHRPPLSFVKQTNLRTQITAVGLGNSTMSLFSNNGRRIDLILQTHPGRITLERVKSGLGECSLRRPVLKTLPPEGVGYRLKVAEWPDGSRVYFDSRGLMHLMSSDKSIPEATLVLADGHVSGWTSEGKLFGAEFYIGRPPRNHAGIVDATVKSVLIPFVRQIRSAASRRTTKLGGGAT